MSTRRVWAGLSSEGFTPVSADERTHLEARVRRLSVRLLVGLVAPLLSIGVTVLLFVAEAPEALAAVGCLGFGFLLPLVSVMFAEDARARRKKLKRDLARGEIERFTGVAQVLVRINPALSKLVRSGTLITTHQHDVRILPESGFVYAIDGAYRDDYIKPDVLEVATASAPPTETSDPSDAGDATRGANSEERTFTLNEGERAELKTRASQVWRTFAFLSVGYGAFGAFLFVARNEQDTADAIMWSLVGVVGVVELSRRFLMATRVGAEAKSGVALDQHKPDDSGVACRVVILKESKLIWSVDGLPAEWRSKKCMAD